MTVGKENLLGFTEIALKTNFYLSPLTGLQKRIGMGYWISTETPAHTEPPSYTGYYLCLIYTRRQFNSAGGYLE